MFSEDLNADTQHHMDHGSEEPEARPAGEKHQSADSGTKSKSPISGREHVADTERSAEQRGEHPEEPSEGRSDQRDKNWVQDPHGEHPNEPAEGRTDEP